MLALTVLLRKVARYGIQRIRILLFVLWQTKRLKGRGLFGLQT
jgi:hypothetical protein